MALGNPVQVRLSIEKQAIYEDEAARAGKPLATYLRERLEASDNTQEQVRSLRRELTGLRHLVEDLAEAGIQGGSGGGMSAGDRAALIETLLLLRHISKPDQRQEARAEMRRNGINMWIPDGKEG